MPNNLVKKIYGALSSPKFVKYVTGLAILLAYVRIFIAIDVTDEVYHIASASLTSLGGSFFENDSYFAQVASVIYEPFVYFYRWLIGSFGLVLFVRHIYFALAIGCFFSFYRFLRKLITPDLAFLISAIPVVFIPYAVPSVGYNTIGAFCLGMGCALTFNAIVSKRLYLGLLGAWTFAISAYVYPSFVIAPAVIYIGMAVIIWKGEKSFPLQIALSALFSAVMFFAVWGVTILRFDFDKIEHSIETTQAYGSASSQGLGAKWDYFVSLIGYVTPQWWVLGLIVASAAILVLLKKSWTWSAAIASASFLLLVSHQMLCIPTNLLITFCFLLGVGSLFSTPMRNNEELGRITSLMVFLGLILCVSTYFTSANQAMATPLAAQFGLIFAFARSAPRFSRAATIIPISVLFFVMTAFNFSYTYREGSIADFNTVISSGPFAGIITGESRANLLKQIEDDIQEASRGSSSILFYDNFPAGYLFSDLRPATRSLFIHPLPNGIWDRELYTQYYQNPQNRPDVFFQFEAFPYSTTYIVAYRTEQWTKPPIDTFFDYLPNTGEYEIIRERPYYKVWRKKSLAKKN